MEAKLTPLAHAILGASGAKKWMTCTMAAAMEKGRVDEDSDYSREGTCAHAVGEFRLQVWLGITDRPMREEQLPDYAEFFNAEFSAYVQEYVDFVIARITELRAQHGPDNVTVMLEQRLRFDKWVPEGFGTGDVVILVPGKVVVIDLKFGRGVYVDGENNEQLKLYALGAWNTYDILYDFDEVEIWIHQPRVNNVSGQTIPVRDMTGLLTWAEELVVPRAKIAWAAYQGDRTEARFSPGDHCNTGFCKARFECAARARKNLELGEMDYAMAEPELLTVAQMEEVTERAGRLAKWAGDVARFLLEQADLGRVALTRFKLVEGRSNRTITDEPAAAKTLMSNGFAAADIYKPPELRGLGELEKLVGKKKFGELVAEWLKKPKGKTTLAPIDEKSPSVNAKRASVDAAFGGLDV